MAVERRFKVMSSPAQEGDSGPGVNVAFATRDRRTVDQHFGAAESFAIYRIEPDRSTLVEVVQFGPLARDGNEDKLAAKIAALAGCAAVYCQAVGASAVNQLRTQGIQALKVDLGTPIRVLIGGLQAELTAGPNAWLARALKDREPRDAGRFDRMAEEGWCE